MARTSIDPERLLSSLAGDLAEAEAMRQAALQKTLLLGGLVALVAVAFAVLLHPLLLLHAGIGGGILMFMATRGQQRAFRTAYKRVVIGKLVARIDPGLRYDPEGGVGRDAFEASLYSPGGISAFYDEDLIEGRVGDEPRRISEMRVVRGSGKSSTTIFQGLFVESPLARPIAGHVAIVPDTAEAMLGALGAKLQELSRSRGVLVRFDDPTFEKAFAVYASDEAVARRLMTPGLRKGLLDLRARAGTSIGVTLAGDRAYTLVPRLTNLFEPSLFRPVTDPAPVTAFVEELRFAIMAMDALAFDRAS